MTDLFKDLSVALDSNDEKEISDILKRLSLENLNVRLPNQDLVKRVISLQNDEITRAFVEAAAEWAKIEHNRKILTEKEAVSYFLSLLTQPDESLVVGAIRALGNICYENEEARKLVDKGGLATIITILENDKTRKNNLLTLKVSGFLLNLLMSNDDLQKEALHLGILDVAETVFAKYLPNFSENQMLFAFLLTVVNHVTDFLEDQGVSFKESLCCIVIDIFKKSLMPEIAVLCLEILHGQSEKDDVKVLLAEKEVCELVFELIEKYRSQVIDEESRSVMKMACDMIVIILTEDKCMYLLYKNGEGTVYKNMVTWLDSEDVDLLSTGVLALGNFARNDTHSIQMVKKGISKKLIALLKKYNTNESDIKVQHALLSTLKNLVIPPQNKPIALQEGLMDVIYPMISLDQYLVVFKLLGTFRMVIDGQEKAALDLISRKEFLERLMHWCYNSDHLGVRGEVPRLLAWLIKHCHSFKPFKELIRVKDAVRCLIEMISSNHAVMQNESFYSLNLLCIGCGVSCENNSSNGVGDHRNEDTEVLFKQCMDNEIGKNLNFVVSKYGDKMEKHTIENLIVFGEQLVGHQQMALHLKENGVAEALGKLGMYENGVGMKNRLEKLSEQICKD